MWSTLTIHLKIDRKCVEKLDIYRGRITHVPLYPGLRIKIIYAKGRFIYALY